VTSVYKFMEIEADELVPTNLKKTQKRGDRSIGEVC
jgi:hypothetical protein